MLICIEDRTAKTPVTENTGAFDGKKRRFAIKLSEMVEFDVRDIPPELTEINYNSGSQTFTFRKAVKLDDNSSDYIS